ncbi:divalent-cation tolerance protein CutA [Streptomyces sp. NBC_01310]|uniref:divalent-cation tolerance protein CutA n=1 Tax=Streptomyces sp. NBC_01310 TaxID=2903820 RepID=UPI0035B6052B|nr:divalent-cation tolerance protein CutA [Streptomyces sp. NBC_01310]
MATTDIVIAQTTVDDEDRARELARGAVEARLAACAHIDAPLTAVYRWKGAVETATEWRISYKTTRDRLPSLAAWIHQQHPYDVPEWITLPAESASAAYGEWVAEETGGASGA